jgi:hypothetical protein
MKLRVNSSFSGTFALAFAGSLALVGCGGDSSDGAVKMVEGTSSSKYVTSSITLPKNSMTAAYDIDGDGTADNRLGNIIQAVSALNLNPQSAADGAVMTGSLMLLLEEVSTDSTQQSAKNAGTKLTLGTKPTNPPKYDGTDTLTGSGTTTQFYGNITAGHFASNSSTLTTVPPVQLIISLPLVEGQDPLMLPVTGGVISYTRDTSGKLTGGQINAAIKKSDVDGVIIPAVAALITAELKKPDASATLKMFDPNMDGTVSPDEIANNQLIANFLAPDVQMFQNGVYNPNPAKTMKDSLSLGFSFTAVAASF